MEQATILVSSPIGVLAILCAIAAFFFYLEQSTGAKLFQYVPPLLFIYSTPILLSSHNRDILYFGSNKLFRSMDQGETWTAVSPDLMPEIISAPARAAI